MDISEKSPKFDLEAGLRARVQHFTPGRGSSSVLNLLQFPKALRRLGQRINESKRVRLLQQQKEKHPMECVNRSAECQTWEIDLLDAG